MRMRHLLPVCSTLILAACQPGIGTRPQTGHGGAATAIIHGQATWRERMATPPGSSLDVSLLDTANAESPPIAEKHFRNPGNPPMDFALPYDAAKIRPDGAYALRVRLFGPDGGVLFTNPTVPVTPGRQTSPVRVPLRRATGGTGGAWNQARARGVGFRAVGNEPAWSVEVDKGQGPALHAALDYAGRKVDVAHTQPYADQSKGIIGFRGTSDEGQNVDLHIQRGRCTDSMNGAHFAATAKLEVGAKTYTGCGRFLLQNGAPGSP